MPIRGGQARRKTLWERGRTYRVREQSGRSYDKLRCIWSHKHSLMMHSVGKRGSLGVYPGPEIGETKKQVAHRAPLFNWETSLRMQWEPSTEPFGTPKRMPKTDLPQRTTESPTSNSAPEPLLWLKIPKLVLLGNNGSYFCVSTPSLQPAFRISLHRMAQRGSFQAFAALADLKCPETKTKI